eukprot:TRINITY_DN12651_c0_g1_i2.p1 TRINITY_DN12651_c0_g1~~TRINITY_DN12651_c0_g1_i2.p1  ORF type:complete len:125 (-),score=8.68 TRINITY_DN12651_c0_g1_i2:128-502(-)
MLLCKLLSSLFVHNTLVCQIALVANKQLVDPLASITLDLLEPLLDIGVRVTIGHIVHDDDTVRATVITTGDGPEPLLSRGVPNLKLDGLIVELHSLDFKVNANGANVGLVVGCLLYTSPSPRDS